jgi:tRNA 2-thiouridine synthesizing protein E
MPTIEYNDITINVDDEGYLLNAEEWNEKVACGLTQTVEDVDECDLTDERIEILKFMRDYYNRFESFPIVRHVCKNVHQRRNASTSSSSTRSRLGRLPDFQNQLQMQSPVSDMSWNRKQVKDALVRPVATVQMPTRSWPSRPAAPSSVVLPGGTEDRRQIYGMSSRGRARAVVRRMPSLKSPLTPLYQRGELNEITAKSPPFVKASGS